MTGQERYEYMRRWRKKNRSKKSHREYMKAWRYRNAVRHKISLAKKAENRGFQLAHIATGDRVQTFREDATIAARQWKKNQMDTLRREREFRPT